MAMSGSAPETGLADAYCSVRISCSGLSHCRFELLDTQCLSGVFRREREVLFGCFFGRQIVQRRKASQECGLLPCNTQARIAL
jgi:hypothetical protein